MVGARRGEGLVHDGEGGGDGRVGRVVGADGDGALVAYLAEEVRDRDGDAVRPQIEADEMGPVGDDPVEPGIGAAPLCAALADHGDQSGLLEAFDEVRHGRPGQAGQRFELTCRQGPLGLQELQGQAVVDQPCGGRRGGAAGRCRARCMHGPSLSSRRTETPYYQAGFLIVYAP